MSVSLFMLFFYSCNQLLQFFVTPKTNRELYTKRDELMSWLKRIITTPLPKQRLCCKMLNSR